MQFRIRVNKVCIVGVGRGGGEGGDNPPLNFRGGGDNIISPSI